MPLLALLFAAALSAATPPVQGGYLELARDERALMLLDLGTVKPDRDRPQAMLVGVIGGATTGLEPVANGHYEFDCKTNRRRLLDFATFTDTLALAVHQPGSTDWTDNAEGSPAAKSVAYLCHGAAQPRLDGKLLDLAAAYWARYGKPPARPDAPRAT